MRTLAAAWNRYWFQPSTATHLAVVRIAFFCLIARMSPEGASAGWVVVKQIAWYPVSFFRAFDVPLFAENTLRNMDMALYWAAAMASIGLFTRISMPVAALLSLYVHELPNNFGKVSHETNVAVVIACFLAFSRAGDKWSVDALIRHLRRKPSRLPEHSGEYTWPVRIGWLCVAVLYCSAGIAKLRNAGLAWATTDSLQFLLLRHQYSHAPPTQLGVLVAAHPDLCKVLASLSLALELSSPLALFNRYLRALIGVGLCSMQLGIYLMMGVYFRAPIVCIALFWPPWGAWIEWAIAKVRVKLPSVAARSTA